MSFLSWNCRGMDGSLRSSTMNHLARLMSSIHTQLRYHDISTTLNDIARQLAELSKCITALAPLVLEEMKEKERHHQPVAASSPTARVVVAAEHQRWWQQQAGGAAPKAVRPHYSGTNLRRDGAGRREPARDSVEQRRPARDGIPTIQGNGSDILCWKPTSTGVCTAQSAYKTLALEAAAITPPSNIPVQRYTYFSIAASPGQFGFTPTWDYARMLFHPMVVATIIRSQPSCTNSHNKQQSVSSSPSCGACGRRAMITGSTASTGHHCTSYTTHRLQRAYCLTTQETEGTASPPATVDTHTPPNQDCCSWGHGPNPGRGSSTTTGGQTRQCPPAPKCQLHHRQSNHSNGGKSQRSTKHSGTLVPATHSS